MDITNVIGDNIRGFRNKRKWSQARLGEEAGLTGNYIGNIERSEQHLSVVNLFKVAKALKIKPHILFIRNAYQMNDEELRKVIS
jgi:transcriptional regulator with XRE-family HTH domain